MMEKTRVAAGDEWWRGAVIYEVYCRSFQDTDGDGIGDLPGVIERLDYLADLGIDAVWLTPFFVSPMKDFGYDVADYRGVDPLFGTLADFDALVARAHALGLKVIIDLVMSHTAEEHPWFVESRASRDNPRADWYVWADPQPDGTPPNNWLSLFGGSAWEWDTGRCQYYLHNFLAEQPDLNFHSPEVRAELLDTARFWLERGVDGFRLDTVNFYFHDRQLRSNPPIAGTGKTDNEVPDVNPYKMQDHLYDKTQPENVAFIEAFRALLDEYPGTTTIGEVGASGTGLEVIAEYTAGDGRLHMCYGFDFLGSVLTAGHFRDTIVRFEALGDDAWMCWAFSNHDVVRQATRLDPQGEGGDRLARLLAGLLLSLRGSASLYQGEELGLREADVPFEALQDPYGIRFWPRFKGRDGCRTPMPWDAQRDGAGFTTGRPWLPVPDDHRARAVDVQSADPGSVFAQYRRFLAWRRHHPALRLGTIRVFATGEPLLALEREYDGERLLALFNLGNAPLERPLPDGGPWRALGGHGYRGEISDGRVRLGPYEACFARRDAIGGRG